MKTVSVDEHLPISVKSLRNEARDKLRRWIMAGQIQPGERIIETDIARQFGTSQGPIREALARLEEDGLVRRLPYKGTYATEIIPQEIYHTFRLRAQIECNGLELTMGRMTDQQRYDLADIVDQMRQAATEHKDDYFHQAQLDMAFHGHLIDWTGVRVYQRAWHSLESSIQRFLNIVHPSFFANNRGMVIQQHVELLSIFQSGNVDRAKTAMREHIMLIWDKMGPELLGTDRIDPKRVRSLDVADPDGDEASSDEAPVRL